MAAVTRLPTDYLESLEQDAAEPGPRAATLDVLDDTQVEHLPPIQWLADHVIPQGSLCALYGAPGSGKSFVAIDLVFSLAAGIEWFGRSILTGGALYIAAEGVGGIGQRVGAWKQRHELSGHTLGVGFVRTGINLLEPASVSQIVKTVETHSAVRSPCQVIVIDTLARCMIGDENDTGDMSRVIAHIDRIREQTGATVLVLHHTRKDSDLERGSSALRGGVDSLIFCEESDEGRQLVCQKQKDAEAFAPIPFSLLAGFGSCVVTSTGGDSPAGLTDAADRLTPKRLTALRSLSEAFTSKGATRAEWKAATKLPESTIYHVTAWLVRHGYVAETGSRFTLAPSGRSALARPLESPPPIPPNGFQNGFQNHTGTPLERGSRLEKGGKSPKSPSTDEGLWNDLLAEADERIGMQED